MTTCIRLENIRRSFKTHFWSQRKQVLKDISLEVYKGEVFGFLGPNGAGKTTTIKIITGLIRPDSGKATIFGESVDCLETKQKIGFLPEAPNFYEHLTGKEFLHYCGKLFGLKKKDLFERIKVLLALVGLTEDQNIQLGKYSQGMLQRIGLAQALINNPDLLILDEPLISLDPIGRKEFKNILINLKKEGKTIFFSSHILEDAEEICDRVGILVKGKLIKVDVLEEFTKSDVKFTDIIVYIDNESYFHKIKNSEYFIKRKGNSLFLRVEKDDKVYPLIKDVYDSGGRVVSVNPKKQRLEDIFLKEVGEK